MTANVDGHGGASLARGMKDMMLMSDDMDKRLAPSGDAIASAVGDETVILQLKNGAYFGLDAVGTRIWELLKEGTAPADICARMADEYDVAPDVIEADVRRLLGELEANELIAEPDRPDD